jgi:hypothetical protein
MFAMKARFWLVPYEALVWLEIFMDAARIRSDDVRDGVTRR